MLRPRIIPCLLVHNKGIVKTLAFGSPKYLGDPINAVRIFNEKEVDELVLFDIDASARRLEPDFTMIRNVASECRMPLCYGGGVRSVEQAVKIIKLGVEKVSLSAAVAENPELVSELAQFIGRQSVVVTLDAKRSAATGAYEVWTHNGTRNTHRDPAGFARELEERGAGEVTINSIDRDGLMTGYDFQLAAAVRAAITVPMTVLGGAGSLADIEALIREFGIVGAAAGSLFVFKGIYKAVLINYPNRVQKTRITAAMTVGNAP